MVPQPAVAAAESSAVATTGAPAAETAEISLAGTVSLTVDSRRGIVQPKPLWRGWLHLLCFQVSLVIGTLLIAFANGPLETTAAAIYAGSVSAMFGTSALYHRGRWNPVNRMRLERLDHAMIFVMIGGSTTPLILLCVDGPLRVVMLGVMTGLTVIAMVTHLVWMSAPEVLVGSTFVTLGCLGGATLPFVFVHAGVAAFTLILVGGALYVLGAVQYHRRWPDPCPTVFGFHEVFHVFISVAAILQYVAIGALVM
jgi:hemolysin III